MNSVKTKVSVIMPVYNRSTLVVNALNSVLSQTILPHEIIVCDDGSEDKSASIAREHLKSSGIKHKVITIQNSGPSFARKTAIKESSGDWYFFLDSDDLWDKDYIESQLAIIESYSVDCVVSNFRIRNTRLETLVCESKFDTIPKPFWDELINEASAYISNNQSLFLNTFKFQPCFSSALSCSREGYNLAGGITLQSRTIKSEDSHFIRKLYYYCNVGFSCEPKVTIQLHSSNRSNDKIGQIDLIGKLDGRLNILKLLLDEPNIGRTYMQEIKREIQTSTTNLFHTCYWGRDYAKAVLIYQELASNQKSVKIVIKYCLAKILLLLIKK